MVIFHSYVKLPEGKHLKKRCGKACGKPQGVSRSENNLHSWWALLGHTGKPIFCWACLKTVDLTKFMAGHLRPCHFFCFFMGKKVVKHGNLMQFGLPNFETTPSHYPMNYSILAMGIPDFGKSSMDRSEFKKPSGNFSQFAIENGTSK